MISMVLENIATGLDVYPNNDDHGCPQHHYCPKGTGKTEDYTVTCCGGPDPTDAPLPIVAGTMQETYARGYESDVVVVPAGWYTVDAGVSATPRYTRTACPKGYYCPEGSTDASRVACPKGTFRNDLYGKDVTDCGPCPAGTYCPSEGTNTPTPCG